MPTTTNGFPYPATSDAPNVPADIQALANAADTKYVAQGTWASWTPVWTASTTNPTIGNGTITGGYISYAKLVHFWIQVIFGSTTTVGSGTYQFNLPVSERALRWTFNGVVRDVSTSDTYPVFAERTSALFLRGGRLPTTAGNPLSILSSSLPITWATGDEIFFSGTYEAA